MPSTTTTVLITGANRGIGRYLTETFLARPEHTVIAAVRNPDTTTLRECQPAAGSSLLLVKIENEVDDDPTIAVQQMRAAGIHHLDLVVVNAGITPVSAYRRLEDADPAQLREMLAVNTVSFISLFRAVHPLLQAAAAGAKLVALSSNAGQLADMNPGSAKVLMGPYGVTKAALNYLIRRVHFENPWLTAWVMNPGFTQTENGQATADHLGLPHAPVSLEESCTGLLSRIDVATREETSGRFFRFDGVEMTF